MQRHLIRGQRVGLGAAASPSARSLRPSPQPAQAMARPSILGRTSRRPAAQSAAAESPSANGRAGCVLQRRVGVGDVRPQQREQVGAVGVGPGRRSRTGRTDRTVVHHHPAVVGDAAEGRLNVAGHGYAGEAADGPGGDLGGVDPDPRSPGQRPRRVIVGGPGPHSGVGHGGGGAVDVAPAVDGRRPLVDQVMRVDRGRGAMIITTNKGIRDWPELLAGDEVLATAILDRLLHRAHVLNIKGRSRRLRDLEDTGPRGFVRRAQALAVRAPDGPLPFRDAS